MGKYALGIDFGTLSARALLVDAGTGKEIASAEKAYAHGVLDTMLPDGITKLPADWALQHPQDYLEALKTVVPEVLAASGAAAEDVIGVGVDFTACTLIPVDAGMEPLCFKQEFEHEPHAYAKLWKHHAAQKQADSITRLFEERGYTELLQRFGGRVSSEYLLPKVLQVLEEAPEIYEKTYKFIEAADWIVYKLTDAEKRNSCCAGYKGMWSRAEGYPPKALLKELNERLAGLVEEKLSPEVFPLGSKAGEITAEASRLTGLAEGTAVAVSVIDAHAAVPSAGIVAPGKMLMIMGTSTCHMALGREEKIVPGMCGVVFDGMIPGYYGFEAGQACAGDHFDWFVKNCVPGGYEREAREKGVDVHGLLTMKAAAQKPGEHGLLALDWWNGNRSVLMDAGLSGLMLGLTLTTRPEDIYRALIEATAYGTRIIIETFEESGIPVQELVACGGMAVKNSFLMQVYADVTNKEIQVLDSPQATALGAAMFGSVAAGRERGGYDDIFESAKHMAKSCTRRFRPIAENAAIYEELYAEYKKLYAYFGKENGVMKLLKSRRK